MIASQASSRGRATGASTVFVCCLSMFMIAVDTTVANLALPLIGSGLHASVSGLQWTIAAYAITTASLMLTSGSIGDRFGRRTVLQAGLAVFTLASAGCSLAPDAGWLIACRALQGAGGSALTPMSMGILTAASRPAWLVIAACGVAVLLVSLASTSKRPRAAVVAKHRDNQDMRRTHMSMEAHMPNARHIGPELHDYIASHSSPPDQVLRELSRETADRYPQHAHMQVDPVQGSLLTVLARAAKARLAIELGTFTGYSAICIARGLPPGAKLIVCDISDEWTSVAKKYWEIAGVDDRIDLRLGPALDTIRLLPVEPMFDLVFIDADKDGYPAYWLELVPRMRPGGLLLAANACCGGEVAGFAGDGRLMYVREFADLAVADPRVDLALTPIGEGLLVASRKAN